MKFLKIDNNKKEKEDFIMKDKEIMKINLVDADYGSSSVGIIVVAKGNYELNIEKAYNIFDSLWNGGESYKNYDEYLDDNNEEDDVVKNNFNLLVNATLSHGWEIASLAEVIRILYPESEAEYLKEDYEFTFCW